jgi:RNA polymerase sigma-70 factor (ECF subfamily)
MTTPRMPPSPPLRSSLAAVGARDVALGAAPASFDELYREYLPFVWRTVRRLGASDSAIEDVVQEIFVAVHRSLDTFEGRSSVRTWVFGIVVHTVRNWRRAHARRTRWIRPQELGQIEAVADPRAERAVSVAFELRMLQQLLDAMSDDKREVFVLVEVGEMSVPEVAEALRINLNTAYARLRAARAEFESSLGRQRARDATRRGLHA